MKINNLKISFFPLTWLFIFLFLFFKFTEAQNSISDSLKIQVDSLGKYGFVHHDDSVVIACRFDLAKSFSDGFAEVKLGSKWGYIDTLGNLSLECNFDQTGPYSEQLFPVFLKNLKWGYINLNGDTVIPFGFEHASPFSEGKAGVKISGKAGYIDKKGNLVIRCQFDEARPFSDSVAIVIKGNKMALINHAGKAISSFYNRIEPASINRALVERNHFFGFTDSKGKIVIGLDYEDGNSFTSEMLACMKLDGKYGFIDTANTIRIGFIYDDASPFSEGLSNVKKNGLWGFIDWEGNIIIDYIFSFTEPFSEGTARVMKDGVYFFINHSGNCVKDCP